MNVEKDFEELLGLFNKHKVRYCIVGAFAVGFYARPRYTKDMDILVEASIENGQKITRALKEFGFGSLSLSAEDFSEEGKIVQLGYEPVRIDILTSINGLNFKKIWKNRNTGKYGEKRVFFIGLNELIHAKRFSGRDQDKADLKILSSGKR